MDAVHGTFGLTTLREMILTRPRQRNELLYALLDFTCYEKSDLRQQSLEIAKELYKNPSTKESVQVRKLPENVRNGEIFEFFVYRVMLLCFYEIYSNQRRRIVFSANKEVDQVRKCH